MKRETLRSRTVVFCNTVDFTERPWGKGCITLLTSLSGWGPQRIGRSSCKPDLWLPWRFPRCREGIPRRSLSFSVPPRCLVPPNSSHRTRNVENDPPQGLSQSNPPSLFSCGFRCAKEHFGTAHEPSEEPTAREAGSA